MSEPDAKRLKELESENARIGRKGNLISLNQKLDDFAGSIAVATSDAPDEYPAWLTYEFHMADLNELWTVGCTQLESGMMPQGTIMAQAIHRIGGDILTMRQKITMTTNVQVTYVENLVIDNTILNLRDSSWPKNILLGGVSWLVCDTKPADAICAALSKISTTLEDKYFDYDLWLLVGSAAWQPDSRLVRHLGIWGAQS